MQGAQSAKSFVIDPFLAQLGILYICMHISGFLINGSLIITFLIIDITQDNLYLYFVYAGLWGMADGIWQTQLNGKLERSNCYHQLF